MKFTRKNWQITGLYPKQKKRRLLSANKSRGKFFEEISIFVNSPNKIWLNK